ncbi:MAG: aldehyde dehydrogenase family protein [Armatimonadetes bacterium]|nr:aldehyde dehydrogenase family protein [Armatimonadota bacterium]CUU35002.1 succinate-semialdehyde dehydrogenase / glutarate-semialdehyde dehydrogenase [Armatimonadetes bacterium DC]
MNRLVIHSPADGSLVGEIPITPVEAIEGVVQQAHAAYLEWREVPLRERAEAMRRLRRLIAHERHRIAELVAREQGKPAIEAMIVELFPPIDMATYLIYEGVRLLAPRRVRSRNPFMADRHCTYYFHPYGVWAVIAPWNYPFTLPVVQMLALVFAGNAVVLKPSPLTPHVGALIGELFEKAGLPKGLVQVAQGGAPQGSALIQHPLVRGVIFTGSVPIGRKVAEQAGALGKKVILELGGKDPAIVLHDADLERTARGIAWSAMVNAGQTCASVERVYVERAVYEPFLEALRAELAKIRVGHPLQSDVDMGPVIAPFQRDRVQAHVEDACAKGGRVLYGGRVLSELGELYYAPTLIADANETMLGMQEETFGPLVMAQPVADVEEAIQRANASAFGLTASLWTRDRARAHALAPKLECASVSVNSHLVAYGDSYGTWGGFKDSGVGRTHGEFGLYEMVQVQYVSEVYSGKPELWWYPYSERLRRITDWMMAFLAEPSWRVGKQTMQRLTPELRYLTRHFSPTRTMPLFLRYLR